MTLAATLALTTANGALVLVAALMQGLLWSGGGYQDGDRLFNVRTVVPAWASQYPDLLVNAAHFARMRNACASCEAMGLIGLKAQTMVGMRQVERLEGVEISPDLMRVLGVRSALGRSLRDNESRTVALISDELWRRNFGGDAGVLGQRVMRNDAMTEIVGVLPAGFAFPRGNELGVLFRGPKRLDIITPLCEETYRGTEIGALDWAMLVKLRSSELAPRATSELNAVLSGGMKLKLQNLPSLITESVRYPLWILLGSAVGLLVIALVNLGSLVLAKAAGDKREQWIRSAVGATSWDLARQTMVEGVAIGLIGGAFGVLLAWMSLQWARGSWINEIVRLELAKLNWELIAVGLGIGVFVGFAGSALPSLLKLAAFRIGRRRIEIFAGKGIVSIEAGLSAAMAVMASLMALSYLNASGTQPGFDTSRAWSLEMATPQGHDKVLARVRQLGGAEHAGLTCRLPLQEEFEVRTLRRVGDKRGIYELPLANWSAASPGYFEAIGVQLLDGRGFIPGEQGTAVISALAARATFGTTLATGQVLQYRENGRGRRTLKIVGVVEDVKSGGMEEVTRGMVYLPHRKGHGEEAVLVVRGEVDEEALLSVVREEIGWGGSIGKVEMLATLADRAVAVRLAMAAVSTSFALAGVLMACLGMVAMVRQAVAKRRHEIGLKLALGAGRLEIVKMLMQDVAWPTALGTLGGLSTVMMWGQCIETALYRVGAREGQVAIWICVGMIVLACIAALFPARGATQIDAVRVLRRS